MRYLTDQTKLNELSEGLQCDHDLDEEQATKISSSSFVLLQGLQGVDVLAAFR